MWFIVCSNFFYVILKTTCTCKTQIHTHTTLDLEFGGPNRRKQERRRIHMYNKAEWEKFAEHMENVGKEISDNLDKLSMNYGIVSNPG